MRRSKTISNALLVLLYQRMSHDRLSATAMARLLNVSVSYLSQLISGERDVMNVGDAFLRSAAEYLGLPVVTCFVLSGRLQVGDFSVKPAEFERSLSAAMGVVAASKFARDLALCDSDLLELSVPAQLLIVELFEQTEAVLLLPERVRAGAMAKLRQSVPSQIHVNKI